jgi:pilus assembly protein CpaC
MTRNPIALLAAASALALLAPSAGNAQADAEPTIRVTRGGDTATSQLVTLGLGKAAIIDLPVEARDVLLSDPSVVDAVVRTARRVYVIGRRMGHTNAFFFDAHGRQIANLELRVEPDTRPLNEVLRAIAPTARVTAEAVNGTLVLSGSVKNASEADRIVQVARRFVSADQTSGDSGSGGGGAGQVINLMAVEGSEQVLVKVRIVEMSRTLVKQLGINLNAENILNQLLGEDVFAQVATQNGFSVAGRLLGGVAGRVGVGDNRLFPEGYAFPGPDAFTAGQGQALVGGYNSDVTYGPGTTITIPPGGQIPAGVPGAGTVLPQGGAVTIPGAPMLDITNGPGQLRTVNQVDASIEAFERAGLLRVLAEPSITAISGEAAKFLAGGEFPVPVAAEDGRITVEFKPFGVGLAFTPVVMSAGKISLKLSTEVSDLTSDGSISTGDTPVRNPDGSTTVVRGINIPALQVRRAETTVEMPSGGALVMAGLIQERTRQAIEGLPGAKDLPVFGSLFRSRDFLNNETELVIVVTPYLVRPTSPDAIRTPADGFIAASDKDGILHGRLNALYQGPQSGSDKKLQGPFGHIIQ